MERGWLELLLCEDIEVFPLSLFISLGNKSDWLLLVLGAESSSGCFFWKSAKHLEQRFIVLLDPQNPQGHRGGRLGGLLRSLPVSPMAEAAVRSRPRIGAVIPGRPAGGGTFQVLPGGEPPPR